VGVWVGVLVWSDPHPLEDGARPGPRSVGSDTTPPSNFFPDSFRVPTREGHTSDPPSGVLLTPKARPQLSLSHPALDFTDAADPVRPGLALRWTGASHKS